MAAAKFLRSSAVFAALYCAVKSVFLARHCCVVSLARRGEGSVSGGTAALAVVPRALVPAGAPRPSAVVGAEDPDGGGTVVLAFEPPEGGTVVAALPLAAGGVLPAAGVVGASPVGIVDAAAVVGAAACAPRRASCACILRFA